MPLWGLRHSQRDSIMLRMSEIARKPPVPPADWGKIERAYRAGIKTLRQIADESGVSPAGILKRAKKLDWVRDLNAKIQAKAEELVNKQAVNTEVNKTSVFTENQLVLENAAQTAAIRINQRKGFTRLNAIVMAQLEELEASSGPEQAQMLRDLGEIMRAPDEAGRDKLNDLYRAVVSLPERSKIAKQLAETLRITVDMERREFGMDKTNTTDDPIAAMLKRINSAAGSSFKPVAQDPAYLGDDE